MKSLRGVLTQQDMAAYKDQLNQPTRKPSTRKPPTPQQPEQSLQKLRKLETVLRKRRRNGPQLQHGQQAAPTCGVIDGTLLGRTILYLWDTGWDHGKVVRQFTSKRNPDNYNFWVRYTYVDSDTGVRRTGEWPHRLCTEAYWSDSNEDGCWLLLDACSTPFVNPVDPGTLCSTSPPF